MKYIRTLLIVGALVVNMLGIAAIVSAQDATAVPNAAATTAPDATPAPDAVPTPYIGIIVEAAEDGVAVVEVVADSPAAAAGFAAGDVITAINDTAVTQDTLRETVQGFAVGDTLTVAVTRGDEQLTLDVTLAAAPAEGHTLRFSRPNMQLFRADRPRLGITIADEAAGVVVKSVQDGSPAETAGILVDDVLTAVNGTPVASAEDAVALVSAAVDAAETDEFTLAVTVTRGDEALDLTATIVAAAVPDMPEFSIPEWRGNRDNRGDNDRGFRFGLPGFNIVPREGEEGAYDVVVPFTPTDSAAMTQDVIDALAAIGITVTPREGEDGVFDLTIPAETLSLGSLRGVFSLPDLESLLPDGMGRAFGRGFRFEIPATPGQPTTPATEGGDL